MPATASTTPMMFSRLSAYSISPPSAGPCRTLGFKGLGACARYPCSPSTAADAASATLCSMTELRTASSACPLQEGLRARVPQG